jgi:hypothetical protein
MRCAYRRGRFQLSIQAGPKLARDGVSCPVCGSGRERNPRRTFTFAESMTYEPHRFRWMLTGESGAPSAVTHWLQRQAGHCAACKITYSHWLRTATQPAAQVDVAEDDAGRGALAAQLEATDLHPDWRFDVMIRGGPGALAAHAGICARGGEQSPSFPRLAPGDRWMVADASSVR